MAKRPEQQDPGETRELPAPQPVSPPLMLDPSPEKPVAFGRYELLLRIGAGGMGEVFLAREGGASPRAVVVKKVLPDLVANRVFVGRFLDEVKVVARLDHPNIARVFAIGDVEGELFLAMEYVQGKTVSRFSRRLKERGVEMPLGVSLYLVEKVCEGLQYAHEATDENRQPLHLVHRDLSPANVCVSYGGEVKIIDFGAAHSTLKEEQTAPRVVIGNLTYMSPEQARKQVIDGRADVYSCGVMLWELMASKALPQKGDPAERWRKAASPTWDPPSLLQPGLSSDLDALVLRALRKDPVERYANAMEFALALRRARQRHAPHITEREVGALLASVFAVEKQSEDAMLEDALGGAAERLNPKVTRRARPALGYMAVGSDDDREPNDLGLAPDTHMERTQPLSDAARTSLGGSSPEPAKEGSSAARPEGRLGVAHQAALYTGIFLAATGFGFLVVWLVLR